MLRPLLGGKPVQSAVIFQARTDDCAGFVPGSVFSYTRNEVSSLIVTARVYSKFDSQTTVAAASKKVFGLLLAIG